MGCCPKGHTESDTTEATILAWRILETVEPGGLPSVGSHRDRHN